MGLSFTNSWFGVIFNPVGYQLQHVSVDQAAREYTNGHPPGAGINPDTETEVTFEMNRQHWIDACAASLKSRDVGYSKANCAGACAGKFDQDGITMNVKNNIQRRGIEQNEHVQTQAEKNKKIALWAIIGFIIAGLLLYLFLSE